MASSCFPAQKSVWAKSANRLVRGYDPGSFDPSDCGPRVSNSNACPVFDRLLGSRIAVANAEVRVPLLGFLGVIPSRSVPPVDLAPFFDAGIACRHIQQLLYWRSSDLRSARGTATDSRLGRRHPADRQRSVSSIRLRQRNVRLRPPRVITETAVFSQSSYFL